ncbi:hypothetical protein BUALT_Bualt13G0090400 [Buddleja alternifolia]|uniref:Retrotransposon gag domain-containing protein n=1 Tax=Buddleja alternifolia TaxID=168488 RepID=A0AAV6WRG1_9LAMI|nr:hypothetical protein BUALT_Bualt13G0090400 [Buddleja alternifolia]
MASENEGQSSHGSFTPFPRVEFPKFDGMNPRTWVRRCMRYFQIVNTISDEHKVQLAAIHLKGNAELWYQGYMEGKGKLSWQEFVRAIYDRFDVVNPELIMETLTTAHSPELAGEEGHWALLKSPPNLTEMLSLKMPTWVA